MGHFHLMELVEEGGILILPTSKRGGEGREGEEREREMWLSIILLLLLATCMQNILVGHTSCE